MNLLDQQSRIRCFLIRAVSPSRQLLASLEIPRRSFSSFSPKCRNHRHGWMRLRRNVTSPSRSTSRRSARFYRDGFLSLHSSTAKVMLYDDSEQLLECRILKNDGVVCSSETLTFNAYLVDVGEPEGRKKPLDDTFIHSPEKKVPK